MKLSKLVYYAQSVLTLLTKFRQPLKILKLFVGLDKSYPTQIEIKADGLKFQVRSPMDVWIIKETCVDREYVAGKVEIRPNHQIIDIGAGLGDFTIYAAAKANKGVVHAYEPLQSSIDLLKQNMRLNTIENVTIFEEAVASQKGELTIDSGDVPAVSTRFTSAESTSSGGISKQANTVAAIALETVINRLPDQRCDLLKIDCEGGEFDIILNSSPEVLKQIDRITLEYHNGYTEHTHTDLLVHLQRAGFNTRLESNPVHEYLGLVYAERNGLTS